MHEIGAGKICKPTSSPQFCNIIACAKLCNFEIKVTEARHAELVSSSCRYCSEQRALRRRSRRKRHGLPSHNCVPSAPRAIGLKFTRLHARSGLKARAGSSTNAVVCPTARTSVYVRSSTEILLQWKTAGPACTAGLTGSARELIKLSFSTLSASLGPPPPRAPPPPR